MVAAVIALAFGTAALALAPFLILAALAGGLLSAVFGLAGLPIAVAFALLAILLRSMVLVWLAALLGVMGGLLGASGVVLVLAGTAVWVARLVRRRRSSVGPSPPSG